MAAKFEILLSTNSQFYFVLKAGNNEIILRSSETYTARAGAEKGIQSVKVNAPNDANYVLLGPSPKGEYSFSLKASNGQVIGVSEQYQTAVGRNVGMASVKANAPTAPVV